jgi:drug/metabolite transporter (DMT)-like permease
MVFGIYWIPLRALEEAGFVGLWATFVFNAAPLLLIAPLIVYRWRAFARGSLHFHICGMLMGLGLVLYASAFLYTEVIRAVLLFYLMPIWGFLLARFVAGEVITPVRWLSMAFGLVGMLVIFGVDAGIPLPRNLGDWMALGAGMVWAVSALMLLTDKNSDTINYSTMFFFWGTVIAGLFALIATGQDQLTAVNWSVISSVLLWIVPLSVIVLIPAAIATVFGPSHLNPGIVGLLFMTEISVGVVSAAIWAGEPFGTREIIGVILITLAGLAEPVSGLLSQRHRRAIQSP